MLFLFLLFALFALVFEIIFFFFRLTCCLAHNMGFQKCFNSLVSLSIIESLYLVIAL